LLLISVFSIASLKAAPNKVQFKLHNISKDASIKYRKYECRSDWKNIKFDNNLSEIVSEKDSIVELQIIDSNIQFNSVLNIVDSKKTQITIDLIKDANTLDIKSNSEDFEQWLKIQDSYDSSTYAFKENVKALFQNNKTDEIKTTILKRQDELKSFIKLHNQGFWKKIALIDYLESIVYFKLVFPKDACDYSIIENLNKDIEPEYFPYELRIIPSSIIFVRNLTNNSEYIDYIKKMLLAIENKNNIEIFLNDIFTYYKTNDINEYNLYFRFAQEELAIKKDIGPYLDKIQNVNDWVGKDLPTFSVQSVSNKNKMLSGNDFKGKYVLIDFWSLKCGPCIAEFGEIKRISENFSKDKFKVLSISIDNDESKVFKFLEGKKLLNEFECVIDKAGYNGYLNSIFHVNAIPFKALINPEGKIIAIGSDLSRFMLETTLKKLVK
jgi:thiol-disulfide isomerase/thioredoxin